MKSEVWSPCLQDFVTYLCPDLHKFSISSLIQVFLDPFQYYSPIYALVFQVVFFLTVFPIKACVTFSSPSYMQHAFPVSPPST